MCAKSILEEKFLTEETIVTKIKSFYSFLDKTNKVPKDFSINNLEYLIQFKKIECEKDFFKTELLKILNYNKENLDILFKKKLYLVY